MDIDRVVEIPDTPDRPAARHVNAGDFGGKERKLPVGGCLRNSDIMDEERWNQTRYRGLLVNENRHHRRLNNHHLKNSSNFNKSEQFSDSVSFNPEDNPYASQNASLFRRSAIDKNSKHETRNTIGAHHMDRGKQMCSKFPPKPSAFQEDHARVELSEMNGFSKMPEMALSRGNTKDLPAKDIREGQTATNSCTSYWPQNFPKMSGSSSKGKEKIGCDTSKGPDSFLGHGNVIDLSGGSQHKNDKQMSVSHHSLDLPRVNRQKRLVRNGCISPHNIESKAKQLAEGSQNGSKDVEQNHSMDVVSSGPFTVDISDIVAEDNDHCKSKGIIHLSSSSASNDGEVNGNGNAGEWRSTSNYSKKVDHRLRDSTGIHSRRNDDLDQISKPCLVANTATKRQKKQESTSSNRGQCSQTISDDTDIVFLDSSGESSRSRPSRIRSQRHQGILDIADLSPELRNCDSQGVDCPNNDDSDAIARQLEVDQMLALELQEQLYHESPLFLSGEIDENLARMLQQEEDALRFSNRNHHLLHPRTSSSSYRQPQSRLLQNASNRRGAPTQLRSRFLNRSRAAPSRRRNFPFPLDMDLDMRLDILEALESAVDFGDLETRHVSQLQREFNENDYEMLLALDENNHQSGASANQINSLPLSTVQTDNFEEACAICLDNPSIGDSIRHLPCLHKFHKDCIDPWLSRRPSCPVCKSSIT